MDNQYFINQQQYKNDSTYETQVYNDSNSIQQEECNTNVNSTTDNIYEQSSSAYVNIDSVVTDENISEEEIVSGILKRIRPMSYINAIKKGDEMREEDFQVIENVKKNLEKKQKEEVDNKVDRLIGVLSKCYISGCKVHSLWGDFIHYGANQGNSGCMQSLTNLTGRMKIGYEVYNAHPNCLSVEVYERRICVVDYLGKTKVIER